MTPGEVIRVVWSNTAHDRTSMQGSEYKDFQEARSSAGSGRRGRRVRCVIRRRPAPDHAEGATRIQRCDVRYCAGCGRRIEKLAALVPPPKFNLVRYHGLLAPAVLWRRHVVRSSTVLGCAGVSPLFWAHENRRRHPFFRGHSKDPYLPRPAREGAADCQASRDGPFKEPIIF
jgi:hypothetical protein